MEGVAESEPEAEKYSEWLNEAPFLALSPTRKSTIVAFLCDLLLQNKAVLKHLESSSEAAHTARKERQQNDIKVRRLRMLCARKAVAAASEQQEKAAAAAAAVEKSDSEKNEDKKPSAADDESTKESTKDSKEDLKEDSKDEPPPPSPPPPVPTPDPSQSPAQSASTSLPAAAAAEESDSDDQLEESESDADAKLTVDEIRMKMNQLNNMNEKLKKQMIQNFRIIRSNCLGQDRWRRRYWNLPNSGGIYVEGGATAEFPELCATVQELMATSEDEVEEMDVDAPKAEESEDEKSSESKKATKKEEEEEQEEEKAKGKVKAEVKEGEENDLKEETPAKEDDIKTESPEKSGEGDEKSQSQFEVPPPVIKIFSFAPRTGCAGKLVQIIEPVEEPESDDHMFLNKLKKNREFWDGWWLLSEEEKDEFVQKLCTQGVREKTLRVSVL